MNLDDVLKDPIVDHSWWEEGLIQPGEPTFDPEKAELGINNLKPEIALEWGRTGPDFDIDEPAGYVERNIPEEDMGDASVIMFARDQMNRGRMGSDLVRALRTRFDQASLKRAAKGLREQLSLEGIVGCTVLDARGYKDCRQALEATKNSPYKHFIKHVMGCECGSPHAIPADGVFDMAQLSDGTGNPMDDFLAMEQPKPTEMVSHCRSTMLPILSGAGDIDESEMDETLTEMMNVTQLPEDEVKSLRKDRHNNKYASNLKMLQAAFRSAQRTREIVAAEPYKGSVDVSEHVMDVKDQPIELEPIAASPIDLDLVDPKKQPVVEIESSLQPSLEVEKLTGEIGDVDLKEAAEPMAALDIDERPGETEIELVSQSPVDVELGQFLEPEFVGTDNLELDDPKSPPGELDIDMRQDMRI